MYDGSFDRSDDYGYNGKRLEESTGLYNYGFRDYAPNLGRWTTVDPIRDGDNWYAYVGNDPVNFRDLWGLELYSYTIDVGYLNGEPISEEIVISDSESELGEIRESEIEYREDYGYTTQEPVDGSVVQTKDSLQVETSEIDPVEDDSTLEDVWDEYGYITDEDTYNPSAIGYDPKTGDIEVHTTYATYPVEDYIDNCSN